MSLLEQAEQFRQIFDQEILPNISRYGFIKKKLWDMQIRLIREESDEFLIAAEQCFSDPENSAVREELVKELSDLVFVCYQFAATRNSDASSLIKPTCISQSCFLIKPNLEKFASIS